MSILKNKLAKPIWVLLSLLISSLLASNLLFSMYTACAKDVEAADKVIGSTRYWLVVKGFYQYI